VRGRTLFATGTGVAVAGLFTARRRYAEQLAWAERSAEEIKARAIPARAFNDDMLAGGLPEIAVRYFRHAIEPGTPLSTTIELDLSGTFLLGRLPFAMRSREVLRAPHELVWLPDMRSGPIRMSGSDGLVTGEAWTRFWLNGLLPVAQVGSSPDMLRSAQFRAASESIWAPAALLPNNDAQWEQLGPDQARVTFPMFDPPIALELTIAPDGGLRSIVGQRWSNANSEKRFRYQPFGGSVLSEARFTGFTVPSAMVIGNGFGTDAFDRFFQAKLDAIRFY
jgi:hypothetical protein